MNQSCTLSASAWSNRTGAPWVRRRYQGTHTSDRRSEERVPLDGAFVLFLDLDLGVSASGRGSNGGSDASSMLPNA